MPNHNVHCAISKKRTGKSYSELHEWIDDQSFTKLCGVNHRRYRHHYTIKDENYIRRRWGDGAVIEWLFHIALDNLETAHKRAQKFGIEDKNYIKIAFDGESRYIYSEFRVITEGGMSQEFVSIQ